MRKMKKKKNSKTKTKRKPNIYICIYCEITIKRLVPQMRSRLDIYVCHQNRKIIYFAKQHCLIKV